MNEHMRAWLMGLIGLGLTACGGAESATNSLVQTSPEPAGDNCPAGGVKIEQGLDDDDDGQLGAAEVDGTEYVCHGVDGTAGTGSLLSIEAEPAGANCAEGGQRIDFGTDDSGDGVLDPDEVEGSAYVCDAAPGLPGTQSLVATSVEAAGANCPDGGVRIDHGLDDDGDGALDPGEIDGSAYVCQAPDGQTSLLSVTAENPGANCPNGGLRINHGVDDNGDGTLQVGEVDGTQYVCDGEDGAAGDPGVDGLQSLLSISPEPPGPNCATGGLRFDHGLDDNRNGVLEIGEIDATEFACACAPGEITFDYTGAIESFLVPDCVNTVTIEAFGAQGGNGLAGGVGGLGAHIQGDFQGLGGQLLQILVGGQGSQGTNQSDQAGGGGGGGSFVATALDEPLLVAGGGGGAMDRQSGGVCAPCVEDGGPGQIGEAGQDGQLNGGAGGAGGNGGVTWPWSGWHSGTGGGGFFTDGSAASNGSGGYGTPNGPGIAFVNGGAGGVAGSQGHAGGFGGGGAAGFTGAGGGGYSGGGSGTHDAPQPAYNGGGGGSFNAGTNPVAESGVRAGNGQIIIRW